MKKFFSPTKAKIILFIPIFLISSFLTPVLLTFFIGWSSEELCLTLPSITDNSELLPTPTPQPFTYSNVVSDMNYESYTANGANCLGNGPTEHLATFLYTSIQIILPILLFIIVPAIFSYLLSCVIIYFFIKLKSAKNKKTTKTKKLKY